VRIPSQELLARIAAGEGPHLEFKSGLPAEHKVARTLAAFANSRGGLLLIGVADDRRLLGAPHPESTLASLKAIAGQAVEPALAPLLSIAELPANGGACRIVVCWQPKSSTGPHRVLSAQGLPEYPLRMGASNRAAAGASLRALLGGRSRGQTDPLEKRILEWVADRHQERRGGGNGATAAAFAREQNIGLARARKAFLALERGGHLFGSGIGNARFFSRP
jgi:Putative DNA-binding domain